MHISEVVCNRLCFYCMQFGGVFEPYLKLLPGWYKHPLLIIKIYLAIIYYLFYSPFLTVYSMVNSILYHSLIQCHQYPMEFQIDIKDFANSGVAIVITRWID